MAVGGAVGRGLVFQRLATPGFRIDQRLFQGNVVPVELLEDGQRGPQHVDVVPSEAVDHGFQLRLELEPFADRQVDRAWTPVGQASRVRVRVEVYPGLDAATCDKLARRAKFDPASDETGAAVPGTYTGAVRWQIPE